MQTHWGSFCRRAMKLIAIRLCMLKKDMQYCSTIWWLTSIRLFLEFRLVKRNPNFLVATLRPAVVVIVVVVLSVPTNF